MKINEKLCDVFLNIFYCCVIVSVELLCVAIYIQAINQSIYHFCCIILVLVVLYYSANKSKRSSTYFDRYQEPCKTKKITALINLIVKSEIKLTNITIRSSVSSFTLTSIRSNTGTMNAVF